MCKCCLHHCCHSDYAAKNHQELPLSIHELQRCRWFAVEHDTVRTSNVTSVTKVRSASTGVACAQVTSHGEYYYNTLLWCDYFSLLSVVSHAFSGLCVYSKFGHHLYPLSYPSAKFRFFCGLRCWPSPWRTTVYSITHSLIQLIWCPGNRSASE